MKNLTRKLFLSICTLAICAVTLVSTTFAWYTTSTDVNVNGLSGKTDSATADGSLLVATMEGNVNTWTEFSNSVTLTDVAYLSKGTKLSPLTVNTNGALDVLKGTSANHSDNGTYILFPLKFKTTNNHGQPVNVYIKNIQISNAVTSADGLAKYDGITTGGVVKQNEKYSIDACYAINLMTSTASTPLANGYKIFDLGTQVNSTAGIANKTGNALPYSNLGAVEYYNNVTYPNPADASKKITAPADTRYEFGQSVDYSAVSISTIPNPGESDASKEVIVYFYLYLDGWDLDCYDACRGQEFNITLSFTSVANDALKSAQRPITVTGE